MWVMTRPEGRFSVQLGIDETMACWLRTMKRRERRASALLRTGAV